MRMWRQLFSLARLTERGLLRSILRCEEMGIETINNETGRVS